MLIDPLLESSEAIQLKNDIVSQIWEKYTKNNDTQGLKNVSASFPEVQTQKKELSPEERKKDIIKILETATSAKDQTVKKAAEELVSELSVSANTLEIDKLEDDLALLEKVEYDKEKLYPVVLNVLARYFFDWKK